MEDRDDYPIIPQPLNKNKEFLNWIYERMICVHGEKDLYDYMINFKSIIDSQVDIQNELTSLREQNEILRQSYKGLYESRNKVEKELASLKEVVKELIHMAENCDDIGYLNVSEVHYPEEVRKARRLQEIIYRAKRISDNK